MMWMVLALTVYAVPIALVWLLLWGSAAPAGARAAIGSAMLIWPLLVLIVVVWGVFYLLGTACRAIGRWLP